MLLYSTGLSPATRWHPNSDIVRYSNRINISTIVFIVSVRTYLSVPSLRTKRVQVGSGSVRKADTQAPPHLRTAPPPSGTPAPRSPQSAPRL